MIPLLDMNLLDVKINYNPTSAHETGSHETIHKANKNQVFQVPHFGIS